MTKKSLSDLLKEEVNKAEAPAPEATPEADGDAPVAPKAKPRRSTRSTTSTRRTAANRQPAKPSKAKTTAKPAALATPAAEPATNIDLAQRLDTLEKELATTQKDKSQLAKTVAGLQKDLETQQSRLFELKDSLAQAEATNQAQADTLAKTQAALDEAKATILKLSEVKPVTPRRVSGVDVLPRPPLEPKARPAYRRGVPEYAIQKGQPKPMLTDADIGWVD
ncbi:hypothetical protein IQ254_14335 [Nodosilinea sp. LEGE 07088]|uniref:hypothetical protein n=1 Tax=Nodosilinea sp. LEGE 07088 TaxID=2777968 RepID=UPI00187F3046|nr:hypothetical protein [Nodosilinea sp. LEGE 07088]MBE9138351.1 hypothetical protein [Nodosilinea sp. LEGE 07088]